MLALIFNAGCQKKKKLKRDPYCLQESSRISELHTASAPSTCSNC